MRLLLWAAFALCCAHAAELEVNFNTHAQLYNGSTWFLRFHASWCGACKSTTNDWRQLHEAGAYSSERPTNAPQVLFASADVDQNRALAEAFGVTRIPTHVLVSEGAVLPFTEQLLHAQAWMQANLPASASSNPAWLRGAWSLTNPVAHVYRPFIVVGTLIDALFTLLKRQGLTQTQAMLAAGGLFLCVVALWSLVLYALLARFCPLSSPSEGAAKRKKKKD